MAGFATYMGCDIDPEDLYALRPLTPPLEEWPQQVRGLIAQVGATEGIAAKAALAKKGVDAMMKPDLGASTPWLANMLEELHRTGHIANDCDGHAYMYEAVLERGGVAPEDMAMLSGQVQLTLHMQGKPSSEPIRSGHVALVVRDRDSGDLLYLDNNLERPGPLDPATMAVTGLADTMDAPDMKVWALLEQKRNEGHPPMVTITWDRVYGLDSGDRHLFNPKAFLGVLEREAQRASEPVSQAQKRFDGEMGAAFDKLTCPPRRGTKAVGPDARPTETVTSLSPHGAEVYWGL